MRVGLMTPGFSAHDAVGNDVLGMYLAFRSRGISPMIFTPTGESTSPVPVFHYEDAPFLLEGEEDLVIYHYCVADPVALSIMRRMRCRIAVRYHNITPAQVMASFSQEFARTSRVGRDLLARLPDMAIDAFLSASEFNAEELLKLGVPTRASHVVPPMHCIDELTGQPDEPAISSSLDRNAFNVVAVGRVVPNKGFEIMARSFAAALRSGEVDFHLHIVGSHDPRMQQYIDLVGKIFADHGVWEKFSFHGVVSASALATLYRKSDLFWTTSLHEGFCVPVVEAMAFSLPILTSRNGALPETCGDAAAYATSEAEFTSQAMHLLTNDEERRALGQRGRCRYEALFRSAKLRADFLDIVDQFTEAGKERVPAVSLHADGDWLGLPAAQDLIGEALAVSDPLPLASLDGRDRRTDFVDWILREGWKLSAKVWAYLQEPAFLRYAAEIEVPRAAQHLSPAMRLTWQFHRFANARFDLKTWEDTAAFLHWFEREARELYGVSSIDAFRQPLS